MSKSLKLLINKTVTEIHLSPDNKEALIVCSDGEIIKYIINRWKEVELHKYLRGETNYEGKYIKLKVDDDNE
jgi:hypothetical protein